jgi:hypothetical protein
MSKAPFKKSFYPPEKNVFVTNTIPDSFKDQIRSIVNSGDYGKLEELLINYPVSLSFVESDLKISLLHNVIQSQLINIQKEKLVELLIKRGMSINITDENSFTPLYYAIKLQLPNIVKILIEKTHNLNRSPKNFDYFRLALEPSIGQCKSQLFNVNDQAMMSKYYSQQIQIERELKKKMNSLPITNDIIKYLVDFIEGLPREKLKFYNLENNQIIGTNKVLLLGDEEEKQFPLFENKLYFELEDITKNIQESLKNGEINEDQILATKLNLTKKIKIVLDTELDTKSLNTIPSIRNGFIYDPVDLAKADKEDLYAKFIERGNYNPINLMRELFIKYTRIQNTILENINNIPRLITDLLNVAPRIGNLPIDLNRLLLSINTIIVAYHINDDFNFNQADTRLLLIKKFNDFIINITAALIRIYQEPLFLILINPDFINELGPPNRRNQEPIIDDIRNNIPNLNDKIIDNYKILNKFIIDVNNTSESGLLYYRFINPPHDATKNNERLIFNNHFILTKYNQPVPLAPDVAPQLMPVIPVEGAPPNPIPPYNPYILDIGMYTIKEIKYYNIPQSNPTQLEQHQIDIPTLLAAGGIPRINRINIPKSTTLIDFNNPDRFTDSLRYPKDLRENKYQLLFDPENNKILNLKILASIYHEKIFKDILNDQVYIDGVKRLFSQENSSISEDILNKILLTTLDSAIKNNFKELVNLSLFVTAGTLVNNKLLNVASRPANNINENRINAIITKKLDIINLQRSNIDQIFYLDENYTSSEYNDIISCLNNNVDIIKRLKSKMHVDPKEYQDLIFKLGNSNILRELNPRNKITRINLNDYLTRHKIKFVNNVKFLNNQLQQEIKTKQLDFIVIPGNNDYLIEDDYFNDIDSIRHLNGDNFTFDQIYNDMIQKQEKSNLYLVQQIRLKLNKLFELAIFPKIKEFLQFFTEGSLDAIINYATLKDNLEPIINDIIYYHMGIDPTKSKENGIPLESSVNRFSDLFINLLDEDSKSKITGIYNERLKTKIIDLLSILCKYYGCVYRNFLKYIFNDTRYRKLNAVLE